MSVLAQTRWSEEDPIRRLARPAALPVAIVIVIVGSLSGNLYAIAAGAMLWRLAMAAPDARKSTLGSGGSRLPE
jgi:hypothetical protein